MSLGDVKMMAQAFLAREDENLTCDRFRHTVQINHQDGSTFILHHATVKQKKFGAFDILLVWTEHCGYFYFFLDDVESWYKL